MPITAYGMCMDVHQCIGLSKVSIYENIACDVQYITSVDFCNMALDVCFH